MRRSTRALGVAMLLLGLLFGSTLTATSASALTTSEKTKVIKIAKSLKGIPYRYGGTTKRGFDCSGYTKYVFKKARAGNLGRTAGAQAHQGKAINKYKKRKGDLIIFYRGSTAYHVGIYVGKGKIWHSPRTGQSVKKEKIWTGSYKVRRIR